ncbi:MAG: hypothetical protein QOJ50_462 [Cryptosporangiaceae bacterium]|nr:hypothetical protein [Cryptosporangiaceae bacterium]
MPTGTYVHLDPLTGEPVASERFSCAPGPAGWRYVGTAIGADGHETARTDLAVDARWRPARLELRSGGWTVRGGAAGPEVLWVRTGLGEQQEFTARTPGFTGSSPAFLVATAGLLALADGESRSVELTRIGGDALAASTVRQRWTLAERTEHLTDGDPLIAVRYRVSDLDTGETADVHLAGDVVLAAPGIELDALESPPNYRPGAG